MSMAFFKTPGCADPHFENGIRDQCHTNLFKISMEGWHETPQ